jgi:hypothetical protein
MEVIMGVNRVGVGVVLALAVLGTALAADKKDFELVKVEDPQAKTSFLAPEGWNVEKDAWHVKVVSPDRQAFLSIAAVSTANGTLKQLLENTVPGAKPYEDNGWTCAAGRSTQKPYQIAACGRTEKDPEQILLVALSYDPKKFPKLDAPGLVRGVANSVKGFKVP